MRRTIERHTFWFTWLDWPYTQVRLDAFVIGSTVAVDTDRVLTAISDLDDAKLWTNSEVSDEVTEMISTIHTRIHDPEAAMPPLGWKVEHIDHAVETTTTILPA